MNVGFLAILLACVFSETECSPGCPGVGILVFAFICFSVFVLKHHSPIVGNFTTVEINYQNCFFFSFSKHRKSSVFEFNLIGQVH